MELREKIAREIADAIGWPLYSEGAQGKVVTLKCFDAAETILNLPEIKEALQAKAMRDLQRLGQEFDRG